MRPGGPIGPKPRLGEKMAFESGQAAGPRLQCGTGAGPQGLPRRCTCFRGSCRNSSGCWAAARVSAPLWSHPPHCSLVPFHPHRAIPARMEASRRPPSGPVSPPKRSPAAIQSSAARFVRLSTLAHLRSAGFPGFSAEEAGLERLFSSQGSGHTKLPLRKNAYRFSFKVFFFTIV